MKAPTPTRLDRDTPRWPEVRITVTGDQATVTIAGVITPVADRQAALDAAASQATALGRPVRARITDGEATTRIVIDGAGATTVLSSTGNIPAQTAGSSAAASFTAASDRQTAPAIAAAAGGTLPADAVAASMDGTETSEDSVGDDDDQDEVDDQDAGDPDAEATPLGSAAPSKLRRQRKSSARKKKPAGKKGGRWRKLPAPIRWGAAALGGLTLASAGVLIVNGGGHRTADAAAPAIAAVPPAGQLYTETGPPGWTQQAAWTVQLAKDAPAPVTTADGITVAVTAADGSASPQTGGTRYLSVLEADGRTRWATPLATAPRLGPVLARVDGVDIALIAGTRDLTYWPLAAGGEPIVVSLPSGATVTPTGLVKLRDNQLAYLHAGALSVVDELPRTEPAIAVDGGALVTQADDGAWWTLRDGTTPTAAKPAPPATAVTFDEFLAVGADHVITAWTTNDNRTCAVAAYATSDATTQAATTLPCASLPRPGATYASIGAVAGVGTVVLRAGTITAAPGVTITAIVDQVYGTKDGANVLVTDDGNTTALPAGTLIPIGLSDGHLLVVDSAQRLYALTQAGR